MLSRNSLSLILRSAHPEHQRWVLDAGNLRVAPGFQRLGAVV